MIAQGMTGYYPLEDDVAESLAVDTEFFIRTVLDEALKFQAHSKSESLSPAHVTSALRVTTGKTPLGYGAPYPSHSFPFRAVPGCDGLFVPGDEIVSLIELRDAPISARSIPRPPQVEWLRSPTDYTRDNFLCRICADAARSEQIPKTIQDGVRSLLSAIHPQLDDGGDNELLRSILDVTLTIARAGAPSARMCAHDLARLALSVLLAPQGPDDRTRRLAAAVLARVLLSFEDIATVRARSLGTLVAALTLPEAALDVLHGAVLGIAAAGEEACRLFLEPCLNSLHIALSAALREADGQDERTRELVAQIADAAAHACADEMVESGNNGNDAYKVMAKPGTVLRADHRVL